jgi:hypothetical protein
VFGSRAPREREKHAPTPLAFFLHPIILWSSLTIIIIIIIIIIMLGACLLTALGCELLGVGVARLGPQQGLPH